MKKTESITIDMITIKRSHEQRSGRRHSPIPVGVPGKPRGQIRPLSLDDHISPTNPSVKLSKSVCNLVKGKLSLGTEIVMKGGTEKLFRQIFAVDDPEEKLVKTYLCYLCTTTHPVAGVIFISTQRFAFCSERPLVFTSPSGGFGWSYYRVVSLLKDVRSVNSHENAENQSGKHIEIQTVDKSEFWLMGFVNFYKALTYMREAVEP